MYDAGYNSTVHTACASCNYIVSPYVNRSNDHFYACNAGELAIIDLTDCTDNELKPECGIAYTYPKTSLSLETLCVI